MWNRKYSLIHLPLFSFFSSRLYRDIGKNWKGANLAYLFLLLAVCWIPPTLNMRQQLLQSIESNQLHLINQLPDIQITDGQVKVEQSKPIYINRGDGTPLAIIDTTGSMNYIDNDHVNILLTDSKLIFRRDGSHFNTLDLSQVSSFHINRYMLTDWLQSSKHAIAPLSYGIFLLLSYVMTLLVLLLLAVVGLILSNMMHASLRFAAVVRLASAAATPSIVLITALALLGYSIPGLVYVAFTVAYLLIGITACKKPAAETDAPKLQLNALLD
jgi:hypothetical protein